MQRKPLSKIAKPAQKQTKTPTPATPAPKKPKNLPEKFSPDWKELDKNVFICSGTYSQCHKRFVGQNRQSPSNCIVACSFAAIRKMPSWTQEVLDEILDIGGNLHHKSRQLSDNRCREYMKPSQIYKYFFWKNLKISMRIGVDTIMGRFPQDSFLLEKIENMLKKLFEKHPSGIFGYLNTYFAFWKYEKYFFIFDPMEHSREGGKWEGLPGLGYCYCIRSTNTKYIAEIIMKNCDLRTVNRFIIYPCIFEKYVEINTKPPETLEDVILLPPETIKPTPKVVRKSVGTPKAVPSKTKEVAPTPETPAPPPAEPAEGEEETPKTDESKIEPKKSISKSRIPPVKTKLPSVTNFVELSKDRAGILRASTHQRDPKFTKYMGAQSMGNAIAALTMLRQYKSKLWVRKVLDDVLKLGEQIHHDIRKLPAGEFPKKVTLNEKEYTPKIDKYGVIGRLDSDDDKVLNLEDAIKNTLVETDCCILIGPNVVAIWKENKKYYMFDPEERDSFGRKVASDQRGVACLTWFTKPSDLIAHYLRNIPKASQKERFVLSKVTIDDYEPVAEDWNNFKALTFNKWILRGNFSQQDRRFPPETRNAQCTAMSTMALTYKEMKEEKDWDPQVVDQVLMSGDELYKSCVDSLQECGKFKSKFLMVDEIHRNFDVQNKRVNLEIDDCLVNGVINAKSDTGIPNLKRGFEEFFLESEAGIVTANLQSMAIWKRDDTYYYYDSHSRNETGVVCAFGTACILRLVTIEDLTKALTRNLGADRQNFYNISRVVVKLLDITEDGVVRPPLNLYEALNDLIAILRSNTSYKDKKFGINSGKQEVPMCVAALTFNSITPSFDWNKEDVDQILTFGDKLYVASMEANLGEDVPDDINVDDVSTNNVKKDLKIGANKFEVEFEDVASGNFENNLKESIEDLNQRTEQGGNDAFQSIIESQNVIASMWRDDNLYYLFNPRQRNEKGEVYGSEEWETGAVPGGEEEGGEEGEGGDMEDREDDDEDDDNAYGDENKDEMGGGDFFGEPEEVLATDSYEPEDNVDEDVDEEEDEDAEGAKPPVEKKGSAYWRQLEEEQGKACVLRFSKIDDLIQHLLNSTPVNQHPEHEFTLKAVKINNTPDLRDIFDPENEEKEDDMRGDWNEFKEMDYGKWILQGVRNFRDGLFPVKNRGKQATPMCMVALAFASLYAVEKFDQEVINGMLAYGDRLFTLMGKLRGKSLKKNKDLNLHDDEIEEILKHAEYKIPDYPKKICMGEKLAIWDAKLEVIIGDLTSTVPETVPNVLSGLTTFFEENNFGIIDCRKYEVAVWKHENFYFMFDPHGTGPSGVKSPVGVSCVTRFKDLEELVNLYLCNLPNTGDNFFEIHAFTFASEVCVRERHPEVKEEKLARIGGFLPVMAGKEILRGDIKLDCTKFDRGVNIHSAPIAIVALALSIAKDPDTWTRLIINEVVKSGEDLYNDTLDKLADRFNPWADRLEVCQVNTDFMLGRLKVNWAIRFTEQRGIVDIKNSKTPNLRQGLIRFFEENSHGVLVADKFTLAVWEQVKGDEINIFIFDANSRGPTGLPGQGGVPCVVKFCNAKVAADHIMACMMDIDKTKTEFSIIPVEVVVGSKKSKRKVCKIPKEEEVLVVHKPPCPPPVSERPITCLSKSQVLHVQRTVRQIAAEDREKENYKRCFAIGRKEMYHINSNEGIIRAMQAGDENRALPLNITAFVFMRTASNIDKWTCKQLETIMETGNQLYIDSLVAYDLQTQKLTLQHLLRRLIVKDCAVKIEIKKPITLSSFVKDYLVANLNTFFTLTNYCILCYKEQLVSIYFKGGYHYLFDPYSRDLNGNKADDGCAMLMRFGDLSGLVDKLLRNLEDDQPSERYGLIVPCLQSVEPL